MNIVIVLLVICFFIYLFFKQAKFGKAPSGKRLHRIQQSPHYKNGSFQNMSNTPSLAEGYTYWDVINDFFFTKHTQISPSKKLVSIKTDLLHLDPTQNVLVWFGHSSYFMQIDGKRILVDPVLSGSASPLPIGTKAFEGSNIYSADDIPEIDFLFISHDHWDHLDYDTIKKIKSRVKQVICGLGVGEHLEYWGYNPAIIIEKDWNERIDLGTNFIVHTVTARHFSGRSLTRNKSLWLSFILQTPSMKIFIGGDSGFDTHFETIGKQHGPFDLAILENGQYNKKWCYIHLMPTQFLTVAKQLQAKRILPVHSGKFALSTHAWDEPLKLLTENNKLENLNVLTPMIGEMLDLNDTHQQFTTWWKLLE